MLQHDSLVVKFFFYAFYLSVADPGFPVGGRRPRRGGANSWGGYISKNLYVKTKESGPMGGARQRRPPESATAYDFKTFKPTCV